MTKSGDVGMVLRVEGVDYESLDHTEQEYAVKRLEAALRALGPGFHVYQYLFKTNRPEIPFTDYDESRWSFLDRGRVRPRIAASRADGDAQLAQYQQTVLLALEDVDNALVRYACSREQCDRLHQAAFDSKRAADLANVRFKEGATGLLDLLDAQRVQLQSEDAYATSHLDSVSAAVSLYRALAGGWPQLAP